MSARNVSPSETIRYINERKEENFDRSQIPVRDRCYREAFSEHPDEIRAVQFAYGFEKFLREKKILINEYDLLAGNAYRYTYNTTLPVYCPEDFDPQYRPPMGVDPMDEAAVCNEFYGNPEGSMAVSYTHLCV